MYSCRQNFRQRNLQVLSIIHLPLMNWGVAAWGSYCHVHVTFHWKTYTNCILFSNRIPFKIRLQAVQIRIWMKTHVLYCLHVMQYKSYHNERLSLPSVDVSTNSSDWLCFLPPAPRGNQWMSVGKSSVGNFMTCDN